jgi:hypothetical protein
VKWKGDHWRKIFISFLYNSTLLTIHNYSAVASSIIGGAHIHIFVFCVINFFWNRLFLWSVNTNIWIWAPPIIELATALNCPFQVPHLQQIQLNYFTTSKNYNTLDLIGLYTLVFCYIVELPLPKVNKINWLAAILPTLLLYYHMTVNGRWFTH